MGIVYRQSFQSAFGKGANGGKSGDDIWNVLVEREWLQVLDADIGMARTVLPVEEAQLAQLQTFLPEHTQAVHKLLHTSVFPPVPDRWLLGRLVDGQVQSMKLIESNYIWPVGQEQAENGPMSDFYTVYPRITDNPDDQPYRYLGRAVEFGDGPPDHDPANYLQDPLTAAGYGEPSFAAFYPICRSVFGHHDPQPATDRE